MSIAEGSSPSIRQPAPSREAIVAALVALVAGDDPRRSGVWGALDEAGWRMLLAEAYRHGVAPIAWSRLARLGPDVAIPPGIAHDFERSGFRAGLENLRLFGLLGTVLRAFSTAGIDALVLKGAYLAETVYPRRSLRWMADADVMVHHRDLAPAVEVLRGSGWRCDGAIDDPASLTAKGHQLPTFVRDGVQIELHRNIEDEDGPFKIDAAGLWERAAPARIAGSRAFALAPEDLLLHLCLHASYGHGWLQFSGGLRHLYDIAAAIAHFEGRVNWDELVARAAEWGTDHCTWLALTLASSLLSARLPSGVLARLAPRDMNESVVRTARYLALREHYRDVSRAFPALSRKWLTVRWCALPRSTRMRRQLLPGHAALAHAYPSLGGRRLAPLRHAAHLRDLARDWLNCVSPRSGRRELLTREGERWALIGWLEAPGLDGPAHP